MEKRIAVLAVIINELESSEKVNLVLHEYSGIIIGRMGIPYRERGVSVISVVVTLIPIQYALLRVSWEKSAVYL